MYRLYQSGIRQLLLSLIIFVLAILFLLPLMNEAVETVSGTSITPDSDFWYSSERLTEIRELYHEEGKLAYVQTRFTYDFLWPVIYTFFFVSAIGYMTKDYKKTHLMSVIYMLPFISVAFDMLENILCSVYFMSYGGSLISYLAAIASSTKWIMILAVFAIMGILTIIKVYQLFRKRFTIN